MTGAIQIRDLRCTSTVGVLEFERAQPQAVSFDLDLARPLLGAARHDDLARTTNYADVLALVVATATARPRDLLETLGVDVARAILDLDKKITAVVVAVRKVDPPVNEAVGSIGVRVELDRSS